MGGSVSGGEPGRRFRLPQKTITQVLTGEFRLTKRLLREQTEAYLASEGVVKAAKKLLELLDSDKEMVALSAAKDILDRVGVGKTKDTMESLLKTRQNGEVPEDWLERMVDEEPKEEPTA